MDTKQYWFHPILGYCPLSLAMVSLLYTLVISIIISENTAANKTIFGTNYGYYKDVAEVSSKEWAITFETEIQKIPNQSVKEINVPKKTLMWRHNNRKVVFVLGIEPTLRRIMT